MGKPLPLVAKTLHAELEQDPTVQGDVLQSLWTDLPKYLGKPLPPVARQLHAELEENPTVLKDSPVCGDGMHMNEADVHRSLRVELPKYLGKTLPPVGKHVRFQAELEQDPTVLKDSPVSGDGVHKMEADVHRSLLAELPNHLGNSMPPVPQEGRRPSRAEGVAPLSFSAAATGEFSSDKDEDATDEDNELFFRQCLQRRRARAASRREFLRPGWLRQARPLRAGAEGRDRYGGFMT